MGTTFNDYTKEVYMEMTNAQKYGAGITFVDIDETLFKTFAKIIVKNKHTGEKVKELTNQEFNTYKLQPDEDFDFYQFRDAKLFKQTSKPIMPTINRIKRMVTRIQEQPDRPSRIIFLTARADFDNRDEFLSAFEEYGIPMKDKNLVYVARTGNMKTGTIAERKRDVILKYLDSGLYRRCRMIDDDLRNLQFFNHLAQNLPEEIKEKVREKYNLNSEEEPIKFYPLLVKESGELQYLAT